MATIAPPLVSVGRRSGMSIAAFLRRTLLALAFLLVAAGLVVTVSLARDSARLHETARSVVAGEPTQAGRLTKIVDWVYHNQGFEKNSHYFLWRRLEATPVQVLEHGGDCSDKSRLTVSLLRELGIPASLAMVKSCPTCAFGHTVALAKMSSGWTPVDPVYDITFPEGTGKFTPIERLKADPSLQTRRLATLRARGFPDEKIRYFATDRDPFTYVTTINWDKNALTRAVARALRAAGVAPWLVPRPRLMDDPKFLVAIVCFGLAGGLALLAVAWRGTRSRVLAGR